MTYLFSEPVCLVLRHLDQNDIELGQAARQFLHACAAQRLVIRQRCHLVRAGGIYESPPGKSEPVVCIEQSMSNAPNRVVGGHAANCDDLLGKRGDGNVAVVRSGVDQ